eukprot:evm.model.scf_137.12 EVM.evm.TU.scf_137.12   scf_137:110461-112684(+)
MTKGVGTVAVVPCAKSDMIRTPTGRLVSSISLEELSTYFGMTSEAAAKKLGVGLTVMKRQCRKLGVDRWPYRKVRCLDTLIKHVKSGAFPGADDEQTIRDTAERLESQKHFILSGEDVDLATSTKKLLQQLSKRNHKTCAPTDVFIPKWANLKDLATPHEQRRDASDKHRSNYPTAGALDETASDSAQTEGADTTCKKCTTVVGNGFGESERRATRDAVVTGYPAASLIRSYSKGPKAKSVAQSRGTSRTATANDAPAYCEKIEMDDGKDGSSPRTENGDPAVGLDGAPSGGPREERGAARLRLVAPPAGQSASDATPATATGSGEMEGALAGGRGRGTRMEEHGCRGCQASPCQKLRSRDEPASGVAGIVSTRGTPWASGQEPGQRVDGPATCTLSQVVAQLQVTAIRLGYVISNVDLEAIHGGATSGGDGARITTGKRRQANTAHEGPRQKKPCPCSSDGP